MSGSAFGSSGISGGGLGGSGPGSGSGRKQWDFSFVGVEGQNNFRSDP